MELVLSELELSVHASVPFSHSLFKDFLIALKSIYMVLDDSAYRKLKGISNRTEYVLHLPEDLGAIGTSMEWENITRRISEL